MSLALKTDARFEKGSVREAVSFALDSALVQARQRFEYYLSTCQKFEKQFGMTTEEFATKFDQGLLGDEQMLFDWYAAKRGLDTWRERFEILSGVSV